MVGRTTKLSDEVVVGAGCVGANVAFRLVQGGARVTVVDAGAPGSVTSGASFAWTNSFGKTPRDYHDLNVAGMEQHAVLAKELGGRWLHAPPQRHRWHPTVAGRHPGEHYRRILTCPGA